MRSTAGRIPDPVTAISTFVLRFSKEVSAGEVRWRGSIEHVQSGETAAFLDLQTLLAFLDRYGIKVSNRERS